MALMCNQVIQLETDPRVKGLEGIYRIALADEAHDVVAMARLDPPDGPANERTKRRAKKRSSKPLKKPRIPGCGRLIWTSYARLAELEAAQHLKPITLVLDKRFIEEEYHMTTSAEDGWAIREAAMEPFLNLPHMHESLLQHHGVAGLVKEVIGASALCRSVIYVYWSRLCRFGFDARSLRMDLENCGAPGQRKFCEPGKRKKAGRYTNRERLDPKLLENRQQRGMSESWLTRILAADALIKKPKPSMAERCVAIQKSFAVEFMLKNAELVPVLPPIGHLPNKRQIERVLTTSSTPLQRIKDGTTQGHFNRSLRGLVGRSWQGVSGPGHTWAIDSTIGDVYLRSSVNRHWILGRPIVYVVIDVWSTAIVGFYVCLSGPSWATAQIALFNSCINAGLLGELWGFVPMYQLAPQPTLPFCVLCDRGEYLSQAGRRTFFKLKVMASYTAPYRPDWKGLVEVIHRIEKDALNHQFVPGAIDARRVEFELRRFDPTKSAMTVREFVHWLYTWFSVYNFTANRTHRRDAHMIRAGVRGTPAGLWRFGHEVGIGYQVHNDQDTLITMMLPCGTGTIVHNGLRFEDGLLYQTQGAGMQDWSALARSLGTSSVDVHHYPGSISRIWTPGTDKGLRCLQLSDMAASSELTLEEHSDAMAIGKLDLPEDEHYRSSIQVEGLHVANQIVAGAVEATARADAAAVECRPSQQEARAMEISRANATPNAPFASPVAAPPAPPISTAEAEARAAYLRHMRGLFNSAPQETP